MEVITFCAQNADVVGVKVKSDLLKTGQIRLKMNFPTPNTKWRDNGNYYDGKEELRIQTDSFTPKDFVIEREVDNLKYAVMFNSNLAIKDARNHEKGVFIQPSYSSKEWTFTWAFNQKVKDLQKASFDVVRNENESAWQSFWNSGGMIDFGKVKDERAKELERRMVLSMYLTRVNCGGKTPPQETGLTFNSWYGKPHMEIFWWHGVHFAQWGKPEILEDQLDGYLRNIMGAEAIAKRQGFEGIRWQKMTDPWGGETASSVGSYLIWQQPHPIYFAEQIYNQKASKEVLQKYAEVVERTAEFMADFAYKDPKTEKYILGPGVMPAQERFNPKETFNPTYELAYWRWGLETAQTWRERMGIERNEKWDAVLADLSPLPIKNGLYLAAESSPDS
ncbi:MAG: hypothetical protein ACI9IP_000563 [Arcticibacterium sp.]